MTITDDLIGTIVAVLMGLMIYRTLKAIVATAKIKTEHDEWMERITAMSPSGTWRK